MSATYQFKGNLRGYLCNKCQENLSGIVVRVYKPAPGQRITEMAVASPKETFRELSDEEVRGKAQFLLAEATTNEAGDFIITLSEKQAYKGEAFEIDFLADDVPFHFPPKRNKLPALQFSITTLQPQWRQTQEDTLIFGWQYALPAKWWCAIRARFGAYVICGQVTDCETKTPLGGLKVSAFDVDLFEDDALGTATTDANGHFILYYSEAAFSKTIFDWLNVEWPAGPDLYFRIETGTGQVLLQEPRSKGHEPDRENAPNCFCIDFCVKRPEGPNAYVPVLFTHVGNYAIASNFDGQGLTNDAQNNAFTGSIPLVGVVPGGVASNAMEYRFKVKNLATGITLIADANYIDPFQIGTLTKFILFPFSYSNDPYMVNSAGATNNVVMDAQGWIRVPRENSLGGVGQFNAGTLLGTLNTVKLMENGFGIKEQYPSAPPFDLTTPAPAYVAGQPFAAAHKAGIHTFEITFEAREVGSLAVAYSTVLPKIVLTNITYLQLVHPSWAGGNRAKPGVGMLEIKETTATGAGCNEIGNLLTANYSIVHPFLDDMTISFEGNSPMPPTFSASLTGVDEKIGSEVFNTSAMQPCAYLIHLLANLRLTSGAGRIPGAYVEDHIAFCKA